MQLPSDQRQALRMLQHLHLAYPHEDSIPSSKVGAVAASLLRSVERMGLVSVSRAVRGRPRFFKITAQGLAETVRDVGYTCFGCTETLVVKCAVGEEEDRAGARGWRIGHFEGNGQHVCPDCTSAVWDALPLGSEEGRARFRCAPVE